MPHTITGYGNIGSEFKINQGKTNKVANFAIAVEDMGKCLFFNCVAFSSNFSEKGWELLVGLKKGNPMYFEGRLVESEYTDKKTNEQKKSRKLVMSHFALVQSKRESGSASTDTPAKANTPAKSNTSSESDDESIPF